MRPDAGGGGPLEWLTRSAAIERTLERRRAADPAQRTRAERALDLAAASDRLASAGHALPHGEELPLLLAEHGARLLGATEPAIVAETSPAAASYEPGLAERRHRELRFIRERATVVLGPDPAVLRDTRVPRFVVLAGAFCALVMGLRFGYHTYKLRTDLGRNMAREASSVGTACEPAINRCGSANTDILFHTKEEAQPWYRIDLGKPTQISSVEVQNRRDCCPDRAIPLVIEVSDDGQHWREVARRTASFFEWRTKFAPVTARYVRARVDRRSVLHLRGLHVW